MKRLIAILTVLAAASGCSLIVEGEVGELRPNINAKRDVRVTLIDMNPHLGQMMDVAIIAPNDPADPTSVSEVEARAILNPLPAPCFELFWPLGASLAATRVDFYADLNGDNMISPPGEDHLWREELTDGDNGEGNLEFIHDVMFADIGADPASQPLRDLTINLTGLEDRNGQLLVVSVTRDFRESPDSNNQRTTTGILVVGSIGGGTVMQTIPGVLDPGTEYTVDFDFDGGATLCRGFVTTNADGATITTLDGFDCDASDRLTVFRDVTAERRCSE